MQSMNLVKIPSKFASISFTNSSCIAYPDTEMKVIIISDIKLVFVKCSEMEIGRRNCMNYKISLNVK